MTQHPPHLPPKASSLRQRQAIQTVPWLLIYVLLSCLAATAVSTAFLAWYVPDLVRYSVPMNVQTGVRMTTDVGLDPFLVRHIDERTITLYRDQAADPQSFAASAFVAHAALLSSDGWAAAYLGDVPPRELVALDTKGGVHEIAAVVADETSGITYIKINNGNFFVAALSPWQSERQGTRIWLYGQGAWTEQFLSERTQQQAARGVLRLYEPYSQYAIDDRAGTLVYDEEGALVGIVGAGFLIPSWYVQYALPAVLSGTPIAPLPQGLEGRVLDAYRDPVTELFVQHPAIEITRVPSTFTDATTLQVGDVLTEVDGTTLQLHALVRQLHQLDPLRMRVIRGGVYTDVAVLR